MNNNVNPEVKNDNSTTDSNVVQNTVSTNTTPVETVSTPVNSTPPVVDTPPVAVAPVAENTEVLETSGHSQATEEVKIDPAAEKKASRRRKLAFVFLAFLILFVWFIPEISSFVNNFQASREAALAQESITTGTLKCTLDRTSSDYDITYEQDFKFTDNKLETLTYIITTKGDMTRDESDLTAKENKCNTLADMTTQYSGITVACGLNESGELKETHTFDYSSLKLEEVSSAYAEQGGTVPEYKYHQDMNDLEKKKLAEGFSCERVK